MEYFIINFTKFMIVFSRITAMCFIATFFGSESLIPMVRFALAFLLSIVIFPVVHDMLDMVPLNFFEYGGLLISEVIIGIGIGFCITISFSVFQLAGQFFTVQMGFGASEVYDPMSQISIPLIGQYLYYIAMLVFIATLGPLFIIKAVYHSFELMNAGNFMNYSFVTGEYGIIRLFSNMFITGLRIAMPMIAALFLVTVALGLMGKASPQMNLLMVGFPISITVSFLLLLILLPIMVVVFGEYFYDMFKDLWFMMVGVSNG